MRTRRRFDWPLFACLLGGALYVASIGGCPPPTDPNEPNEPNTPPPAAKTIIKGTVTNAANDAAMADVSVTLDPAVTGVEIMTDASGKYSAEVPADVYALGVEVDNFAPFSKVVELDKDQELTVDIALTPTVPVLLTVTVAGDATPGATVTASVSVEILDGTTTVTGYEWTQTNSVAAALTGDTTATASVKLPPLADYKEELLMVLNEPPITEAQLPPNVPLPETEEGEFPAGLLERFYRPGISPFAMEEAGHVGLMVTVSTSSGDYEAEADIITELPWDWSQGLLNVPIGERILLHGKTQDSYDWELDAPTGSSATLSDATSQDPYFTADGEGVYLVTVTDEVTDPNNPEVIELEIHAGEWQGAITGQNAAGRPLAKNCTICHNGTFTTNPFADWMLTGHAEIFKDQINTSTHYSTSCLPCHTVGYNPDVDNGGIDDAADWDDFLAEFGDGAGGLHSDPGNWTKILKDFEDTAQLSNIQCENCHGPNTDLHFNEVFDAQRISLSADVCGTCHGEPLRHGRFQQWQLSGHANYELAIGEGDSGNCSRCHTANGFLSWEEADFDAGTNADVTWTSDEVHSQTCVACHDPHAVGSTTGIGTDATLRVNGDTPVLTDGFAVYGAGKGAICMTCHSSRRGLRNDGTWADTRDSDPGRAPHTAAQTAVLMGQNAYLVEVGTRGSHSYVEDTCVTCHMRATPPPDLLSYALGGTNHTFFAGTDICADCHGEVFDAESIQGSAEGQLEELKSVLEDAILDAIADQIALGRTIDIEGVDADDETATATITDVADIAAIEFGESHGNQAISVTFTDDTEVLHVAMGDVLVMDGMTELGGLYDDGFADDALPKAGWNYFLVHSDGSLGVHNPTFTFTVLERSIAALNVVLDD